MKDNADLVAVLLERPPKGVKRRGVGVPRNPRKAIRALEVRRNDIREIELLVLDVMGLKFHRIGTGIMRGFYQRLGVFQIFPDRPLFLRLDEILTDLCHDKNTRENSIPYFA